MVRFFRQFVQSFQIIPVSKFNGTLQAGDLDVIVDTQWQFLFLIYQKGSHWITSTQKGPELT